MDTVFDRTWPTLITLHANVIWLQLSPDSSACCTLNAGVNHRPKLNFVMSQERKASWSSLVGSLLFIYFFGVFSTIYHLAAIFEAAETEKLGRWFCLQPCYLKCGPHTSCSKCDPYTSSVTVTWGLGGMQSQALR